MLDWKRLALLALVTFFESAIGALVGLSVFSIDASLLMLAVAGGAGAVISLAYNALHYLKGKLEMPELNE